jgi:nickel/cobalt transporter (NicO) family protein
MLWQALDLSIGLSFVLGMLHALEPGHGKTAMFVYMLQERRSVWHPVVMGLSTAASHACSLVLIALAVHMGTHLLAGDEHGHEHVGAALQWISSLLLIGVGLRLAYVAWRPPARAACSCCRSGAKSHAHEELGTPPPARPAGSMKLTVLMGVAIGLLPCPTALASYFSGLSSGNPWQGYVVIAVFSSGIGLSLATCGWVLQGLGGWFRGRFQVAGRSQRLAYFQAAAILGIGLFYLVRLALTGHAHD